VSDQSGIRKNRWKSDIRLWIVVPLVLMLPINLGFWFAYVQNQLVTSTPTEHKIPTLWGYFESDTFKGITTSLVIPIFMFLFERRFKILENYETSRAERISAIIKNNKEKRWETVKNTQTMWNDLYELTSEVCFFTKSDDGIVRIKELQKRLNNFITRAEEVVNDWNNRLPNLSSEDTGTLVNLVNHLFEPTITVASYIEDDIVKKNSEISDLQLSLTIIQGGVKTMFHFPLMNILTKSIWLLEIIEDNIPEHEVYSYIENVDSQIERLPEKEKGEANKIKDEICKQIDIIKQNDTNTYSTIRNDKKFSVIVSIKKNKDVEDFCNEYEKTIDFLKSKKIDEYYKSDEYTRLYAAYYQIPQDLRVQSIRYIFTREGIKIFADMCDLWSKVNDAEEFASLDKKIDST
jgi:hypothetical protein